MASLTSATAGRYHKGHVFIIDVSQSLEHDHQNSLYFLRKDCTNITSETGTAADRRC